MKMLSLFNGLLVAVSAIFLLSACDQKTKTNMNAPRAKKIEKVFTEFGNTRIDNYFWLNERENPEVIAYLEAENDYTQSVMKDTEDLQKKIYDEIVGRIKQNDMSVPYQLNGYEYYTRFEEGKEYPVYCRKVLEENAPEEVMLNGNEMAKSHAFFHIGGWEVSSNNEFLVYTVDTISRRKYTIHFKNLKTGKTYTENIPNTSGNVTWANDNKTVFYTIKDETLRPFKIFSHKLGTKPKNDQLVYHEEDDTFYTYVYKTKSKKYIVIGSESTLSSEFRIINALKPADKFQVFQKRQPDLEYDISHQENRWLIRTNSKAQNFRLMETPENKTNLEHWVEVIPNRDDILLEYVNVFDDFYVLGERKNGLPELRVFNMKTKEDYYIEFDESDYFAYTTYNPDYSSQKLRYGFTSLKTPESIYDFDMVTKEFKLLKQEEVLGGYDASEYITERIYANARDGEKIPISIVYKKGYKKDGTQPLFLYAYGSYGSSMDSYFRSARLSLLDRGFCLCCCPCEGRRRDGSVLVRRW